MPRDWSSQELARYFGPARREWFERCRRHANDTAAAGGKALEAELDEIKTLVCGSMAQLHLRCAESVRASCVNQRPPEADLEALADRFSQPPGLVRDLAREMSQEGKTRPGAAPSSSPFLLIVFREHGSTEARPARLVLERVPGGKGDLYPATELAFVNLASRDAGAQAAPGGGSFREAVENAVAAVKREGATWPAAEDIRWSVKPVGDWELPLAFRGDSAGAAFALALANLLGPGAV